MTVWIILAVGWATLIWIGNTLGDIRDALKDIQNDHLHYYKDLSEILREIEATSRLTLIEVEKISDPPSKEYSPYE